MPGILPADPAREDQSHMRPGGRDRLDATREGRHNRGRRHLPVSPAPGCSLPTVPAHGSALSRRVLARASSVATRPNTRSDFARPHGSLPSSNVGSPRPQRRTRTPHSPCPAADAAKRSARRPVHNVFLNQAAMPARPEAARRVTARVISDCHPSEGRAENK